MNFYKARRRAGHPVWDFTCYNDNQNETLPVGYCRRNRLDDNPCMHNTPEEARECYRQWLIDEELRLNVGEIQPPRPCEAEGCSTITGLRAHAGSYFRFLLCPDHQTREDVSKLLQGRVHEFFGSY